MKKRLFLSITGIMLGVGILASYQAAGIKGKSQSNVVLACMEALADGESTGNTGPREKTKCTVKGYKMVCLSVNSQQCTDSDCF